MQPTLLDVMGLAQQCFPKGYRLALFIDDGTMKVQIRSLYTQEIIDTMYYAGIGQETLESLYLAIFKDLEKYLGTSREWELPN